MTAPLAIAGCPMSPDSPLLPPQPREPPDLEAATSSEAHASASSAPAPTGSLVLSDAEIAGARAYVEASRTPGTQRAYAGDWRRFSAWCQARSTPALPAPRP